MPARRPKNTVMAKAQKLRSIDDVNESHLGRPGGRFAEGIYTPTASYISTYENALPEIYNRDTTGLRDDENGETVVLFVGNDWAERVGNAFLKHYTNYITNLNYVWKVAKTDKRPPQISAGEDITTEIDAAIAPNTKEQVQIVFMNFSILPEDGFAFDDAGIDKQVEYWYNVIVQLSTHYPNLKVVYGFSSIGYDNEYGGKDTPGDLAYAQQYIIQQLTKNCSAGWGAAVFYPITLFTPSKLYKSVGWRDTVHEYYIQEEDEQSLAAKAAMQIYCTLYREELPSRVFFGATDYTVNHIYTDYISQNYSVYTTEVMLPVEQGLEAQPKTYQPGDRPERVLWVNFKNSVDPGDAFPGDPLPGTAFDNLNGVLRTYWREQYQWQLSVDDQKARQARVVEFRYDAVNDQYWASNNPYTPEPKYSWEVFAEWFYSGRGPCIGSMSFSNLGDWTERGDTVGCNDTGYGGYGRRYAPAPTPHPAHNDFYVYEAGNPSAYLLGFGADMYVELDWAFMTEYEFVSVPKKNLLYVLVIVNYPDTSRGSLVPHEHPISVVGGGVNWTKYAAFDTTFNGSQNWSMTLWIPDAQPDTETQLTVTYPDVQEMCAVNSFSIEGNYKLPDPSKISWGSFDSSALQILNFIETTKNNIFCAFTDDDKFPTNDVSPWVQVNKIQRNDLYIWNNPNEANSIQLDMSGTAEVIWFNLPMEPLTGYEINPIYIEEDFTTTQNPVGTTYNSLTLVTDKPGQVQEEKVENGWLTLKGIGGSGNEGSYKVISTVTTPRRFGEAFYVRYKSHGHGEVKVGLHENEIVTLATDDILLPTTSGNRENRDTEIIIVARNPGYLIYRYHRHIGRWVLEYVDGTASEQTLQPYIEVFDTNQKGIEIDRAFFGTIAYPFDSEETVVVGKDDTEFVHPTNFLLNYKMSSLAGNSVSYHKTGNSWYTIYLQSDGTVLLSYTENYVVETFAYVPQGIEVTGTYDCTVKVANGVHEFYVNGKQIYSVKSFRGLGSIRPEIGMSLNITSQTLWSYIPLCNIQEAFDAMANRS